MSRTLNVIHHKCCMDDCGHEAKLSIITNQCERICPKCDDGCGVKTMLPSEVARERGSRWDEIRHFTLSYGRDRTTREAIEAVLPDNAVLHNTLRDWIELRHAEQMAEWRAERAERSE